MLRPRLIPVLLLHDGGLVKTRRFAEPKYVGDPINAVRIFNEKEVDELMVVDIDATVRRQAPNYERIAHLAAECRMPMAYGGGITSADEVHRIVALGVEKVALSAILAERPQIVAEAAASVGSQSVVCVLDVKSVNANRRVFTHNGTVDTGRDPVRFARELQDMGAGEIILNSIDRDGEMMGYDLDLAADIRAAVSVPITMLGGAGSLEDIGELYEHVGIVGAAAGSLFVFKGIYRAVLISYPNRNKKDALQTRATSGRD